MFFYPLKKLVFCWINSYGSSFYHHFNDFLLLFLCGHGIGFPGFSRAHVLSILCLLMTFFASNWLKNLSNPPVFYQKGFITTFFFPPLERITFPPLRETISRFLARGSRFLLSFSLLGALESFFFSLPQSFISSVLFRSLDHIFNKKGLLLIYPIAIHHSGISFFLVKRLSYPTAFFTSGPLIFIIILGVFPSIPFVFSLT